MKAIVAVDSNWGIGYRGNLLQFIPEDMKFFKQMTLGKVVIMGRETFESLPEKKPLIDRINIVLSKNEDFHSDGIIISRSLDELFAKLKSYKMDDILVIGGESVYRQLLPYCTTAYVTKIKSSYIADRFIPDLDKENTWELVSESGLKSYNNIQYSFNEYLQLKTIVLDC